MPAFCGVIGCSNKRSKFPEKSYFRLPAIDKRFESRVPEISIYGPLLARTIPRPAVFVAAAVLCYSGRELRVRSLGRPADLEATSHPDWAPTQNLGHSKLSQKMMAINSARYKRIQDKVEKRDVFMAAEAVMNMQQNTQPGSDEAFFKGK
ncbi:hypothetical protein GWK47_047661 [Chionoecetes opilio]|uniref:Uncharacterized protein n=1 Tax=Chionoecetes opilio TaxID=41210 RepID=A0A8J4YDE8_CHIOP|nr:hypothetical protein GWK47_047661 [Chionoecetes opilio]